ncbi:hypothetical protein CBR_g8512 [Chara braunii]|uniref:Response regulatory domain-containing protein n=1 Tax=Chara braunii TaxID=69332 RepID=A0A388KMC6_CHABU|nr:hypothetical protein CBR_g8512 [Chara braunii]|eukprot:GBG71209.1 hypothetical protein CBR_g8512 [Chara braunii]
MAFIDQFDFFPDHIPGKSNRFADALSRRLDHCTAVYSTFEIGNDLRDSFIRGYQADPKFRDKCANCSSPNPAPFHYRIQEGYLLVHTRRKDLLCVPSDSHLRPRLLGEFHDAPATRHFGVNRTIGRLRERFWWPGLLGDVTRYCESCEVCRCCKSRNHRPYGTLRPLPVPLRQREAIAMDITGPFPKHKTGVDGILTVVDRLTKFAMFLPCRYHAKAPELAELTEWQKIAAVPNLDLPFTHLRREFYNRSCAALSQALGDREQYSTFAEIIDKAREIIKTNRSAAHEKSPWQPTYVEKVRTGPRQQHFAAVQQDSGDNPAATPASSDGDQVAVVQPRSNNKSHNNGKAKSASQAGNGQPGQFPWVKFGLTEAEYKMPVMDGYSATRAIRAMEQGDPDKTHHLPIIALTAHTMAQDKLKCLEAGMDAYLMKPMKLAQLVDVIKNFCPHHIAEPS